MTYSRDDLEARRKKLWREYVALMNDLEQLENLNLQHNRVWSTNSNITIEWCHDRQKWVANIPEE